MNLRCGFERRFNRPIAGALERLFLDIHSDALDVLSER